MYIVAQAHRSRRRTVMIAGAVMDVVPEAPGKLLTRNFSGTPVDVPKGMLVVHAAGVPGKLADTDEGLAKETQNFNLVE